ncbi:MAG TPA: hypothetical protein VEH04_09975 [Verrucomicrobiae bacterium]|nr:hypothetical protein [Verrucomicrobiae bacterium]
MQTVRPVNEPAAEPLPKIHCPEIPPFDASQLSEVRRAFATAPRCGLRQAWLAREEPRFAPAYVQLGWRNTSLHLFAELQDEDVFSNATQLNQRTWEIGDVFEMFLGADAHESYVELHVTPNNHRLQLRYPDVAAIENARRTRDLTPVLLRDAAFHSQTWVSGNGWQVYAEVPSRIVSGHDASLELARWRFSFARYDYTRGIPQPVISCTSPHLHPDFHRQREWGFLAFEPALRFQIDA